jgi:tetratricopeptide (TPR) repeat protein
MKSVVLPEQQYLSTCPACGEQVDVTALEPFAKISCPSCHESVRVRRKFDHFIIVREIGEGGMSRVFEAEDETLGRRVALKILNRKYSGDLARMAQFQQEALTTARVTHPNVIKLYSVGFDQGHFFIAMELVTGGSLEQRIKREGHVSEADSLKIGHQVAEGLRAAHRMGLLHRDVKPANILFTDLGVAKVVDFGLAIFVQQQDKTGEIWATPFYVSPEKVIENKEDFRSDLFSLGATLFHAITGQPPHKVKTASLQELRMVKCRRVSLEDTGMPLGERTVAVVDRLLAFSPEERPASYDQAVDELRLAEGLLDRPFISLASQKRKLLLAGGVAILVAFLVGWIFQGSIDDEAKAVQADEFTRFALTGAAVTLPSGARSKAERYLEARAAFLKGDWAVARPLLEGILGEGIRQPTLNWARFHAALCAAAQGDATRARALFRELSIDPGTALFFKNIGDRQQVDLGFSIEPNALKVNASTEDILTPLSIGLSHWYLGDPEKANTHFLRFLEFLKDKHPIGAMKDYRALAEAHARDAKIALPLLRMSPMTSGGRVEVTERLAALEGVRSQLTTLGKVRGLIQDRIASLTKSQTAVRKPGLAKLKEDLARRERELAQMGELSDSLPSLVRGYDFSSAITVLKEMQFQSPEVKAALQGRLYLHETAQAFVNQLFADIAARGWRGTLRRRDAPSLTGTVRAMNHQEVVIRLDRGEIIMPLANVVADMLLEMAEDLEKPLTDSTECYRREELMVAFAKLTGQEDAATNLAAVLMEENREFRSRWMKVLLGGI